MLLASPIVPIVVRSSEPWVGLAASESHSSDGALAFGAFAVVLMVVWTAILIASIRVRSDRERPVARVDHELGFSGRATRFKGGAVFAVDGRRFQGSFPFGELVVDEQQARIRLGGPMRELRSERMVRRADVVEVRIGGRFAIPYVELVDDERTHGRTRFYGGKTLVRALAERGWPVG